MRILVVEDDIISMKLMVSILQKNGFETVGASTALCALQTLARDAQFDLIISDIMMPHIDGFSFLRQLRNDRRLSRIPVILCTALGDDLSVVKGIELGAVDYIVKPINAATVISKVSAVMSREPETILVVDDEPMMRDLLVQTLQRAGWQVVSASGGREALELISESRIRLVLSDVEMPEMDGFELLANIKEQSSDIPVILISERTGQSREDVLATGADDFIAKPFRNLEILASIHGLLR